MQGTVYWFTGISGVGKSSLGKDFYDRIKVSQPAVVFLDGDELRDVFGNDLGYTITDRKKSAMRNANLCKLLADQGLDVVCATISLFHEVHDFNRKNIKNYREIYLKASLDTVRQRNQKGIYTEYQEGQFSNVMGLDLPIEEPRSPDLLLETDGKTREQVLQILCSHFLNEE